ncbi:MAG TPA: helix-turn-helix domain-containing protein [Solirubrobacteraceae bacterium]|nr:helix-turn-helix domain-containing protein [Solirubrobacteraceae bacterium]
MIIAEDALTYGPIPPETIAAVRPALPAIVEQILASIRSENPIYADVLEDPEGIGIRLGIEQAVKTFLDAIEQGRQPSRDTSEVWRRLGEAEFQAGRNLDALRAAWRTGTRAAWRGAAEVGAAAGVPTPTVIALAEAIFVYADELGTDVVEGYLRIASDEAGERERRRRRLAALLLDPDDHEPEAIAHAAELARWPLPQTLAVLALSGDDPAAVARRMDVDVLAGTDGDGAWLVVPDPDGPGRPAALKRAVAGATAALGPTVVPREAHRSLRWSRAALELVERGAVGAKGLTRATDHLATMLLLSDRELAEALASQRLAPLEALPDAERERLLETLTAWLAHQRHTPGIAADLHVHPQTVRYRVNRLRELFGETLDAPEGRFELELALRARPGGRSRG